MTLASEQNSLLAGTDLQPVADAADDPANSVAWELRDARLLDHSDGSVAFEQQGVEVPAAWSQKRHQHPGPEVLPRRAGHSLARMVAEAGGGPHRRRDHTLGGR